MTTRARVSQADLARIFRAAKKAGVRASVIIGEGADAIRIEALAEGPEDRKTSGRERKREIVL